MQSAATGQEQPPLRYGRAKLEESMQRAALLAAGTKAIDCNGDASGAGAACANLDAHSSLLAQGVLREPARPGLASAHEEGAHAVLAHAIHVRSPDGVWDDQMWKYRAARPAYTLHAALIDTSKGTVLWKNQVLVRALPGFSGADPEALRLLYDGFPNQQDR